MKTPSERFHELLDGIGGERLAAIDRKAKDPKYAPPGIALREDPDPFGREWDWIPGIEGVRQPAAGNSGSGGGDARPEGRASEGPSVIPFRPARSRSWRPRLVWASGIAASLALVAVGVWAAALRGGRGPLREQQIAAWVSHRMTPGQDGVGITAGTDDKKEEDKPPLAVGEERAADAKPPALSNMFAPLRVQRQLVVPEVPGSPSGNHATLPPLQTVTESVRSGSLFYLEFSTAAAPSAGTAVVVRLQPGPPRPLWQEVPVNPIDGTAYFGPLEMGEGEAVYVVIISDRVGTPLLSTVATTVGPGNPEAWRPRLAEALLAAGHGWYGIQRVHVQPDVAAGRPR